MACVHLCLDFTCFFTYSNMVLSQLWLKKPDWPQNLSSTAKSSHCPWHVCGTLVIPLHWLAWRSCEPVVSLLCPLCVPLGNCYSSYRTFPCKVLQSFSSSHLFLFSNVDVEVPGKTYPDTVAYPDTEDNSASPPFRGTRLNNVIESPLAGWARHPYENKQAGWLISATAEVMFAGREHRAGEGEERCLQSLLRAPARHPQTGSTVAFTALPGLLGRVCSSSSLVWTPHTHESSFLPAWTRVLFLRLPFSSSQDFPTHCQHPAHAAGSLPELYCPWCVSIRGIHITQHGVCRGKVVFQSAQPSWDDVKESD